MPFVLLALTVTFFSAQFLFSKGYQLKTGSGFKLTFVFMSLMSSGIILEFLIFNRFRLHITHISLAYAFFYAVLILVCEIASLKAFNLGKVSIVSLYTLIGSVVLPFLYGTVILNEGLTLTKIIAIILICISFIPPLFDNNTASQENTNKKSRLIFFMLCITVFLSNGLITIIQKAHQMSKNIVPESDFLILASIFTFLLSAVCFFLIGKNEKGFLTGQSKKTVLICIMFAVLYGLFNGAGTILSMICAKTLPSSIQFPVISGGVVSLTAILSFIFYREKITTKIYLSIGLAVLSIIIFSL